MYTRIASRLTLPITVLALLYGGACMAQVTIDQQNMIFDGYLGPSTAAGQSFTPTLNGIDFAAFNLATAGASSTFQVNLFAGEGYGGALLASTPTQTFTNGTSFLPITFGFSSTVALTPGNHYTLQVAQVSGSSIYELEGSGNPYAGGVEYDSKGIAQTSYDTVFKEGINASAVPEPGNVALLIGMGITGAGFLARRRKQARQTT